VHSSATTIITIGLVNAGALSFLQSLGVIIGSNIGTTVTAQLVAFNMTAFGQVLIPVGFLIGIFGRRYRFLGKPLFYFGLLRKTESVYRILDGNIVGLGLLFPRILEVTVSELRARDAELQRAINERYREQLITLKREGDLADSRYLEVLSIIEAANAKVRDLRKLAEQYSVQKRSEPVSLRVEDPLPLRNPVAGDDLQRVPDLPVERCVPRVNVQEGCPGELSRRGDHDQVP